MVEEFKKVFSILVLKVAEALDYFKVIDHVYDHPVMTKRCDQITIKARKQVQAGHFLIGTNFQIFSWQFCMCASKK